MRILSSIQPRSIIAITGAIALLMVASAFLELRQSRQELYHVMEEEALSLMEAVSQSSQNTILATEGIEDQLAERLFNNAYFIAHFDSLGLLTEGDLSAFAAANDVYRINIFDRQGNRILSSYTPHAEHAGLDPRHAPRDYIRPILEGTTDRLVIGLKDARYTGGQRYAVAVRRTAKKGGAIVLNLNADDLLEFRRQVGIGKLVRDLGDNEGVEYVALQDTEGIIAASQGVEELSSIASDSTLHASLAGDTTLTRTAHVEGREVFEVFRPLRVNGAFFGVLRIGLSMDEIHATEERMLRRIGVVSLVLIGLGVLVLTVIMANQNYRLARRRLTAMETFTGNVLEHMQDAVVTVDAKGYVTLFNRRAQDLFGITDDVVVGKPLSGLTTGAAACVRDLFASSAAETERKIVCSDGAERNVAVSLSITRDEHGELESRAAVVRDLTDAKRLQRELQRRDRLSAMGELASGVAHEIRNPLNAIAMIAQRFEKEFLPRSGVREYRSLARVLKSEARRVNGIIQHFLTFARPAKLKLRPVPAQEFLSHVATLFEGQAQARGIDFSVVNTCKNDLHVDRDQMTQAVLNLLQNALDATPPRGSIELRCFRKDQGTVITVQDSGRGIRKDDLDKIFNLYFTTKGEGTGMGLPISHQIVSLHHGSLEVESKEGRGSRFLLTIPLREE